uniref:Uncharacterized protein n=1 Tax=Micrurus surinamensis TaxID=129470 RepID=A0A2D4Q0C4_MICSU
MQDREDCCNCCSCWDIPSGLAGATELNHSRIKGKSGKFIAGLLTVLLCHFYKSGTCILTDQHSGLGHHSADSLNMGKWNGDYLCYSRGRFLHKRTVGVAVKHDDNKKKVAFVVQKVAFWPIVLHKCLEHFYLNTINNLPSK